MDIKDLNRSQFLLLLLLVMCMTSITTAIVTVALVEQSSPSSVVGDSLNQAVVRTIEKVVPGATTTIVKIVKEIPTLPNEGELVAQAVNNVSPSVVIISQKTDTGLKKMGTGFTISNDLVVTGSKNIPTDLKNVTIVLGKINLQADLISREDNYGVALFRVNATGTEFAKSVGFARNDSIIGQTDVGLTMSDNNSPEFTTGIILNIINTNVSTTSSPVGNLIRTNAVTVDNIGGPVINTKGEIIGIGIERGYALSAGTLKSIIDQIK